MSNVVFSRVSIFDIVDISDAAHNANTVDVTSIIKVGYYIGDM